MDSSADIKVLSQKIERLDRQIQKIFEQELRPILKQQHSMDNLQSENKEIKEDLKILKEHIQKIELQLQRLLQILEQQDFDFFKTPPQKS